MAKAERRALDAMSDVERIEGDWRGMQQIENETGGGRLDLFIYDFEGRREKLDMTRVKTGNTKCK
jgi:hypothetical protein